MGIFPSWHPFSELRQDYTLLQKKVGGMGITLSHERFGESWNWTGDWNRIPIKPNSSADFITNLSIQNVISFLSNTCSPQDWRISKKSEGLELRRNWWPSWVQTPFCVPQFLAWKKKRLQLLRPPLNSKG